MVQDFYQVMGDRLTSNPIFKDVNTEEGHQSLMDNIERFIMTRLYRNVFCTDQTDDEIQDLKVQVEIALFSHR